MPHCEAENGQANAFIGCDDWGLEQIELSGEHFPGLSQQNANASISADLHDILPAD